MHETFNFSILTLFSFYLLTCGFIELAVKSGFLPFLKWLFFLFSKGAGRGSEIFHIRMSQKHKRGENRVVDVEEKKETLITWLFNSYKMVISKMSNNND